MENLPSISNPLSYDINKFICPLHKLNIVHYCKCKDRKEFLLCEKCFDDENCPNYRHTFHDLGAFKIILRTLFNNHPNPKLLEYYLVDDYAKSGIPNQKKIVLEELGLLFDLIVEKMRILSQEITSIFELKKESIDVHPSQSNRLEKLLENVIDERNNEKIKEQFSDQIIKEYFEQNDRKYREKIMNFRKCFENSFFKNLDNLKNLIQEKDTDFSNTQLINNVNDMEKNIDVEKINDIKKLKDLENSSISSDKILSFPPSIHDPYLIKNLKLESNLESYHLDKILPDIYSLKKDFSDEKNNEISNIKIRRNGNLLDETVKLLNPGKLSYNIC